MKKYTQEFKDSTVQLIINERHVVTEVAQDLDLNPATLYSWVTTYKKLHNIPLGNQRVLSNEESELEELKRLRRENKLLKQERDILKKR